MQLVALMSWVEGSFCAFWMLALEQQFHNTATSFFYTNIDDHDIRRGDMGWILAWWWRPVASKVALDLPHWAMCSAQYRLIRMAIKMACESGAFFSVVNFISCITIAKWPCYGPLKIKPGYNTVCYYYALIYSVYYDGPPTAMNAVLVVTVDDGQAIAVIIERQGKKVSSLFYWFYQNPSTTALPNPLCRGSRGCC